MCRHDTDGKKAMVRLDTQQALMLVQACNMFFSEFAHGDRVRITVAHGDRVRVMVAHGDRVRITVAHGDRVRVTVAHGDRVRVTVAHGDMY